MYAKIAVFSAATALIATYFSSEISRLFHLTAPIASNSIRLFTPDELKLYNGIENAELYLSVLGKVFDVSKGSKHYGSGKSYNFFIGRDCSRSFITGRFTEGDVDDNVADLSPEELRSLNDWVKFYKKEYKLVGKLISRYYNEKGKSTPYGKKVKKLMKKAAEMKQSEDAENLKYPPCNVEWDAVKGTRVWCTNKSGGISRDWVGVPRQFYQLASQDYRCACVQASDTSSPKIKQYEGCDDQSDSCYIKSQ